MTFRNFAIHDNNLLSIIPAYSIIFSIALATFFSARKQDTDEAGIGLRPARFHVSLFVTPIPVK